MGGFVILVFARCVFLNLLEKGRRKKRQKVLIQRFRKPQEKEEGRRPPSPEKDEKGGIRFFLPDGTVVHFEGERYVRRVCDEIFGRLASSGKAKKEESPSAKGPASRKT